MPRATTNSFHGSSDQTIAAELWDRWSHGERVPMDELLAHAGQLTARQLVEVLLDDQRQRWIRGDRVRAETYLHRYPRLIAVPDLAVDLIYGEYLLAAPTEGPRDQSTFLGRFPEFRDALQQQFEMDDVLSGAELGNTTASDAFGLHETAQQFENTPPTVAEPLRPPAAPTALPTHFGRYQVIGLIGAGGMGQVYKARDPEVDRLVAVKVPNKLLVAAHRERAIDLFIGEARAAGKVDHPNVLAVYDVGREGQQPYVVMKYLEGVGLDAWLDARGGRAADLDVAVDLVCQVADGLHAVHQQGIVHRDIKPSNVIIDGAGHPKLMDFGVAYLQNQRSRMIEEVNVAGTWSYMPPEARRRRVEEVGTWSDVYSLATMLFQMVTGRLPAQQRGLAGRSEASEAAFEWATGHDVVLDKILRRALDPRPESRYRSAEQFADALRDWARCRRQLRDAWLTEEPSDEKDENAWPDYVELGWLLLMQPTRLYRRLRARGIDKPGDSMLKQWIASGPARGERREYVRRMLVLVCLVAPVLALSVAMIMITIKHWQHVKIQHMDTLQAVLILVATGVLTSTVFGLFRGPAWCASWGIAWGVGSGLLADNVEIVSMSVFGVTENFDAVIDGVFVGMAVGISGGVCRSVGTRLAKGEPENMMLGVLIGMAGSIAFGVVFGLLASLLRPLLTDESSLAGVIAGVTAAAALGLTALIVVYRLPVYPLEAIWSTGLYWTQRLFGISTLHLTPALHHEISYFRQPFLASHVLLADETDPELAARVLRACDDNPGQRQLAQQIRARLFCEKVETLVCDHRFEELAHWLTAISESNDLPGLEVLRDAARCLAATAAPLTDERQQESLRQAERHLDRVNRQLEDEQSEWASALRASLEGWREAVEHFQRESRSA